jgi:hypothetical protein
MDILLGVSREEGPVDGSDGMEAWREAGNTQGTAIKQIV